MSGVPSIDDLQRSLTSASNHMKQRIGQLEKQLEQEQTRTSDARREIANRDEEIKALQKETKLWEETADNRQIIYDQYVDRERTAFDMLIKSVMDYMDEHELIKATANKYQGAVLVAFKGMNKFQKDKFTTRMAKQTEDIEKIAKKIKERKK